MYSRFVVSMSIEQESVLNINTNRVKEGSRSKLVCRTILSSLNSESKKHSVDIEKAAHYL